MAAKFYHIKQWFIVLIAYLCFAPANAQVLAGIKNNTVSVAPGYTVSNGTNITVTGEITNIGVMPITDNVHVNLAIDTSTTTTPKYYWRSTHSYPVSNFLAGSTFSFSISDMAAVANSYKGGGTTIVVWTKVGFPTDTTTTTIDSVKTTLYIIAVPVGLNELNEFENSDIKLQNPIHENMQLNYDETIYTKVELLSLNGQSTLALIESKALSINHLSKGMYLLRFYDYKTQTYITKKMIIE